MRQTGRDIPSKSVGQSGLAGHRYRLHHRRELHRHHDTFRGCLPGEQAENETGHCSAARDRNGLCGRHLGIIYASNVRCRQPGKRAAVVAWNRPTATFQLDDFSMANIVAPPSSATEPPPYY